MKNSQVFGDNEWKDLMKQALEMGIKGKVLIGCKKRWICFWDMMTKWFSMDGRKMLLWVSEYSGREQRSWKFQNKMIASALELISCILKIQLTPTTMWAFLVSKRENALKTDERYQDED